MFFFLLLPIWWPLRTKLDFLLIPYTHFCSHELQQRQTEQKRATHTSSLNPTINSKAFNYRYSTSQKPQKCLFMLPTHTIWVNTTKEKKHPATHSHKNQTWHWRIKNGESAPADKTVQAWVDLSCRRTVRVHRSFQQIGDILMKGVLSPALWSPFAPWAPGCGPEWAGVLPLGASHRAEPPTRRTWTRGLSLTAMWPPPPPPHTHTHPLWLLQDWLLWQHLSLSPPPHPLWSSRAFLHCVGSGFNWFTWSAHTPATQDHVRQCQQAKTARQLAVAEQQADVYTLGTSSSRVPMIQWRVFSEM